MKRIGKRFKSYKDTLNYVLTEMKNMKVTLTQKIDCLRRELRMRERAYRGK